jgi:hypothetical protein
MKTTPSLDVILDLNHPERLLERNALKAVGRYPTEAAARRMHRIV